MDADGIVLDAVGYGVFEAGEVFAGEGAPAPDAPAGTSLARLFADVDTDHNADDWAVADAPTPGSAPLQAVPEPAPGLLVPAGLAVLAWGRRRARRTGVAAGRGRGGTYATPPGPPRLRG